MELLLVILLLAVVAAVAFALLRRRQATHPHTGLSRDGGGIRGRRAAARAAQEDPMAMAVERHSAATDPQEAAEEELRLRAQANRVASDLHAREAAALESEASTVGRVGPLATPPPAAGDPVYADERTGYVDAPADHVDERPAYADDPAYVDERAGYADERAGYAADERAGYVPDPAEPHPADRDGLYEEERRRGRF